MVTDLVQSYNAMWCNMFAKLHFLDSHFDLFPENRGAVSNIHGERFQPGNLRHGKAEPRRVDHNVVTDYCLHIWNRRSTGKI